MSSDSIMEEAQKIIEQNEEKKEAASFIDFKMVTFALSGKDYAIDIMHVKEIAKAGKFTYVPNTLPFVLGVYNLRGEIIPILDLRIFFNIEVNESSYEKNLRNLLILSIDDQTFGLVVDKIDKVIGVQKSTIQPPHPLFGDINIKYISGVVESNKRLYVLLDVLRIFSSKETIDNQKPAENYKTELSKTSVEQVKQEKTPVQNQVVQSSPVVQQVNEDKPEVAPVVHEVQEDKSEVNIKFISENLAEFMKFYVSDVNISWVKHRYGKWLEERGSENIQLQNEIDAQNFLKGFFSVYSGEWWTKEYADSIKNILPENSAKQIVVWNPGCGKGMEAYSLACVLKQKYPEAKIKIFAQDIDLLNVSNASIMSVPNELAAQWYAPYLTQKANNEYTFNAEIKDSVMFEYHDCKNTNVLPMVDIIFARDVLSYCDQASQETIINDFQEKLKGNGIAIVGDNEVLPSKFSFGEKSLGAILAYTKD